MRDEKVFRAYLEEVHQEIRQFQIKYGMDCDQFVVKLDRGELSDPFAYELEQDAMRWEDLVAEKKMWSEQLKRVDSVAE